MEPGRRGCIAYTVKPLFETPPPPYPGFPLSPLLSRDRRHWGHGQVSGPRPLSLFWFLRSVWSQRGPGCRPSVPHAWAPSTVSLPRSCPLSRVSLPSPLTPVCPYTPSSATSWNTRGMFHGISLPPWRVCPLFLVRRTVATTPSRAPSASVGG